MVALVVVAGVVVIGATVVLVRPGTGVDDDAVAVVCCPEVVVAAGQRPQVSGQNTIPVDPTGPFKSHRLLTP